MGENWRELTCGHYSYVPPPQRHHDYIVSPSTAVYNNVVGAVYDSVPPFPSRCYASDLLYPLQLPASSGGTLPLMALIDAERGLLAVGKRYLCNLRLTLKRPRPVRGIRLLRRRLILTLSSSRRVMGCCKPDPAGGRIPCGNREAAYRSYDPQ